MTATAAPAALARRNKRMSVEQWNVLVYMIRINGGGPVGAAPVLARFGGGAKSMSETLVALWLDNDIDLQFRGEQVDLDRDALVHRTWHLWTMRLTQSGRRRAHLSAQLAAALVQLRNAGNKGLTLRMCGRRQLDDDRLRWLLRLGLAVARAGGEQYDLDEARRRGGVEARIHITPLGACYTAEF
jgi:hypothetical protein